MRATCLSDPESMKRVAYRIVEEATDWEWEK
jgi:hypothetical protein